MKSSLQIPGTDIASGIVSFAGTGSLATRKLPSVLYLLGASLTILPVCADTHNVLTFAVSEQVPYAGGALQDNGYVGELVREAFRRQGYRIKLDFYPWARARRLAIQGEVDGVFPAVRDAAAKESRDLVYSDPFPGETIGFLKRRDLAFSYASAQPENREALRESLQHLRIGTLRGMTLPFSVENGNAPVAESVSDNIQNLDKLEWGRIQLAVMDKYTAADLMANHRPHLIGRLEFMRPPLAHRSFHVGFPANGEKGAKLATVFNEGLEKLRRDGTLEKILKKHGLNTPPKTAERRTQLVIGTVNNSDMVTMQQLSREYEKTHPDVRLVWRVLDENTLRQRLLSDLAIADGQFDVMTIGTYEAPIWARRGWLIPLRPDENYDEGDLLPTVRSGLSYNGELYALPFYAESSMTYYRKDLFERADIAMPVAPTYDDILRFAARIHNPSAGIYGICLRGKAGWGENVAILSTMVNVHGGRWFDQRWRPELDSQAWEAAVNMYRDLLQRYGPPDADRNGFNENLKLFAEGACGIWIDATVAAGMLFDRTRSSVASQLGYAAAPVAASRDGGAWLWSWALAVPASSHYKNEAAAFIAWATSREYVRLVAQRHGWLAVPPGTRKSTYANQRYLAAAPFASFVEHAIQSADPGSTASPRKPYNGIQYVGIPEFPAIGNLVGQEVSRALRGEQSVKEALAKAQARITEQMKLSGYTATPDLLLDQ